MKLKGGFIVESVFIVPFITLIIFTFVYAGFLYYDRSVIDAGAAEIAWRIVREELKGTQSHKDTIDVWKERLESRLLLCEHIAIETGVDDSIFSYNIGAYADISMRIKVPLSFISKYVDDRINVRAYAASTDAYKWTLIRDAFSEEQVDQDGN